jgi:hypothetical protein
MSRWSDRLRFLWEEEAPPPEEVPRTGGVEPAGVPRALQRATRFAVVSVLATSLLGPIIGVRLVAAVDAAPSYTARCIQLRCKLLRGNARLSCYRACVLKTP